MPHQRFNSYVRSGQGFSLIELVVVIAILAILVSISMPAFTNIRKDAQISQAKNTLVTVVRECAIGSARGKSLLLGDIRSANASIPGYRLEFNGAVQGTSQYESTPCETAVSSNLYANPTSLVPGQSYAPIPWFMVEYNPLTGATQKFCGFYAGVREVYSGGCSGQPPPPCRRGPRCVAPPPPGVGFVDDGEWS